MTRWPSSRVLIFALLLAGGMGSIAWAADANLVTNGQFEPLAGWFVQGDCAAVAFDAASQAVSIAAASKPTDLRQGNLELSAERKYRLRCKVKTEGGDSTSGGVTIANTGWTWAAPSLRPKTPNSDWTELEAVIAPHASSDGKYQLVIAGMKTGRILVKNVRLEPQGPGPATPKRVDYFSKEDLIVNGGFDEGPLFPDAWTPGEYGRVFFEKKGGHRERPCLAIRNTTAGGNVRQYGLQLIAGETYKLSGYLKTKGFVNSDGKLSSGGVYVINDGWRQAVGIQPSGPDSDWTYYEKVFRAMPSEGSYAVALHAAGSTGELAVCDLKLTARQTSLNAFTRSEHYTIIPLRPNPQAIPADQRKLVLSYPYLPVADQSQYECQVLLRVMEPSKLPAPSLTPTCYPIRDGLIEVDLHGIHGGKGDAIEAAIVEKAGGRTVCKTRIPIRIVPARKLDLSKVRPLNNLVSEVQNATVAVKPGAAASCPFTNPRDGWIWAGVTPQTGADELSVALSEASIGVVAKQEEGKASTIEAMRWLKAGEYQLNLSAAREATVAVVVRAAPELVFDAPNYNSWTDPTGKYDWAFMEKHVLPQCNVFLRGRLSPEEQAKAKARGIRWIANTHVPGINFGRKFTERSPWTPEEIVEFLALQPGFRDAQYDGCSLDEFFLNGASPVAYAVYARAFERLYDRVPANKLLYPYLCCGAPSSKRFYSDFLATVFHRGGTAMFEAYGETRPTEADAAAYLDDFFVRSMKLFKACYPGVQHHLSYAVGIHANMLDITQFYHPEVDSKYYLDMQMNLLANHPEFQGLSGVNTYTCGHADEETVRWMCRLVRHYCIEGQREMLSKQHGFTYLPGQLANGDFVGGTASWTCTPAEEGSLRADSVKGYGVKQKRWGSCVASEKTGDTFLRMKRSAQRENKVSQEVKNLVPGKLYSLQVVVADTADIQGKNDAAGGKKPVTAKHALRVQLDQVEVIPEKSYVYLDKAGKACRANLHRIVFRAKTPATVLTLSDWTSASEMGGPAGQEMAVNFVQLKPYYE